ncbi:hypothetical protein MyNCGM683_07340 [Achromobacter xylosoxidans]
MAAPIPALPPVTRYAVGLLISAPNSVLNRDVLKNTASQHSIYLRIEDTARSGSAGLQVSPP